jgi:hypothetical protein
MEIEGITVKVGLSGTLNWRFREAHDISKFIYQQQAAPSWRVQKAKFDQERLFTTYTYVNRQLR